MARILQIDQILTNLIQPVYNVKNDFNAVGDGVADDTAEIQAASDAIPSVGGSLYFPTPPVRYVISAPIKVSSLVHVFGDGPSSQILIKSASPVGVVGPPDTRFYGAFQNRNFGDPTISDYQISIHDLLIDCNKAGNPTMPPSSTVGFDGIFLQRVRRASLYNLYIKNPLGQGIYWNQTVGGTGNFSFVENNVHDIFIEEPGGNANVDDAGLFITTDKNIRNIISRIWVIGGDRTGIYLEDQGGGESILSQFILYNQPSFGLSIIQSGAGTFVPETLVSDFIINVGNGASAGIRGSAIKGLKISHGLVTGGGVPGVSGTPTLAFQETSTKVTIDDVNVTNLTQDMNGIQWDATNSKIIGGRIEYVNPPNAGLAGIFELAGANANLYAFVQILNAGTRAMNLVGATSRAYANPGFNPQGVAAITVGASPFTYTAGPTPEAVYIDGGTVSDIAKNAITVYTSTGKTIWLEPGEAVTVTYSVLPTMNADRK